MTWKSEDDFAVWTSQNESGFAVLAGYTLVVVDIAVVADIVGIAGVADADIDVDTGPNHPTLVADSTKRPTIRPRYSSMCFHSSIFHP